MPSFKCNGEKASHHSQLVSQPVSHWTQRRSIVPIGRRAKSRTFSVVPYRGSVALETRPGGGWLRNSWWKLPLSFVRRPDKHWMRAVFESFWWISGKQWYLPVWNYIKILLEHVEPQKLCECDLGLGDSE